MIILYFVLLILLLVFAVFYSVQFYNVLFRGFAPYLNTNGKTIYKIISEIDIRGDETIYELGCGNAGFLQLLGRKYSGTKLYGYEYSFLPWFIANVQLKIHGVKNLQILRKNFLNIDLSEADIIYCYLNPGSMERLKEKFKKECKPDAQIISNRFQVPGWKPKKIIEVGNNKVYYYQN